MATNRQKALDEIAMSRQVQIVQAPMNLQEALVYAVLDVADAIRELREPKGSVTHG